MRDGENKVKQEDHMVLPIKRFNKAQFDEGPYMPPDEFVSLDNMARLKVADAQQDLFFHYA